MLSDADLIDQIATGDRQSFAVLVQRYERLVHATAIRSVHDSHLADDVAQESFVAAFQSLSTLRDKSSFGAWLMGIVRRKAARVAQQRQRSNIFGNANIEQTASTNGIASNGSVSNGIATDEIIELLELVEQLPEQERLVVGLRHFQGHSTKEIATITGRPRGTVTKQLSRAHERLHNWLTQESAK